MFEDYDNYNNGICGDPDPSVEQERKQKADTLTVLRNKHEALQLELGILRAQEEIADIKRANEPKKTSVEDIKKAKQEIDEILYPKSSITLGYGGVTAEDLASIKIDGYTLAEHFKRFTHANVELTQKISDLQKSLNAKEDTPPMECTSIQMRVISIGGFSRTNKNYYTSLCLVAVEDYDKAFTMTNGVKTFTVTVHDPQRKIKQGDRISFKGEF